MWIVLLFVLVLVLVSVLVLVLFRGAGVEGGEEISGEMGRGRGEGEGNRTGGEGGMNERDVFTYR